MENPIRGYTSSIHIPSLTEPLYEMMNPYSGRLLMAYSNTIRDAAIRSFYNITNKVTYVFTVPFSSTVPYVLIWNYCKRIRPNDINSVLAPLNSSEYDILISSGWIEMASFYMFPNRSDSGFCSLYNGNNSVTSYVPSRSGIDSCNRNKSFLYRSMFVIFCLLFQPQQEEVQWKMLVSPGCITMLCWSMLSPC